MASSGDRPKLLSGGNPQIPKGDGDVKVTFFAGSSLDPVPPESSKDPDARYVHLHEDEDEAQLRSWIAQAAALPGWDGF